MVAEGLGLFLAITPNGSLDYHAVAPQNWRLMWGKGHPNMLNDKFWAREFENKPYFIGSLPDSLKRLSGDQRICIVKLQQT